MKDISKTVSRRMEAGELVRADGSRTACRGEVTRLKGQSGGHVPGERHEIGTLCQPVYIFTGSAAGAAPGDILEQGTALRRIKGGGPGDRGDEGFRQAGFGKAGGGRCGAMS